MNCSTPHYTLRSMLAGSSEPGRWRFVLQADDGSYHLEVDDVEPDVQGERLELLAVVRGLEALDRPSRVTLMTPSTYVREGIRYGLAEWRRSGWRWECFGQLVPVKNSDLWQRVDTALRFHVVECRTWRIDPPHRTPETTETPGGWHLDRAGQATQPCRTETGHTAAWPASGPDRDRATVAGRRGMRWLARIAAALAPSLWTG
jgi:ribonuclease HI